MESYRSDDAVLTDHRQAIDRLVDLLDLLPPPRLDDEWNRTFWHDFARTELGRKDEHRRGGQPEIYITSHLEPTLKSTRRGDADTETIQELAMYGLMFFDGERPKMWKLLDDYLVAFPTAEDGAAGKRWAEEVCSLSWQLYSHLYIRYRRQRAAQQSTDTR